VLRFLQPDRAPAEALPVNLLPSLRARRSDFPASRQIVCSRRPRDREPPAAGREL